MVLEGPSPAASQIFVLWQDSFRTGTAISGGQLDVRSVVVHL